ncbi:MAG: leucine-rich repeat protein [Proteobacteria bacterium]|nr:leucine-rich repeat protein [Pseudomonadota bacterium]
MKQPDIELAALSTEQISATPVNPAGKIESVIIDESIVPHEQEINASLTLKPNDQSSLSPESIPLAAEHKLSSSTAPRGELPEALAPIISTDPLWVFLNKLDITSEDLQRLGISEEGLQLLFQQEMACSAGFKWSRFEQLIDNSLHGLFLSQQDIEPEIKKRCLPLRVWPQEQSILLRRRVGLRKAYAVSKLVDGIQFGMLEFVRLFVLSMLLYRLGSWASSGQRDFGAFKAIFTGNNQKGIDSLTGLMAKLKPSTLKFILTSPLLLGGLQSLWEFTTLRQDSEEQIVQQTTRLAHYVTDQSSLWRDVIREIIPVLSHFIGSAAPIDQLTRSLNWNAQLTAESKRNGFSIIHQIAEQGRKFPQWTAIGALAKLTQGIGFKDFLKLKDAGYPKDVLLQQLFIKESALKTLIALAQKRPEESALKTAPRRMVASFWLWWLGQSTSWIKQRIPFFTLKAGLLFLEIYFFSTIANSLVKAIECPDKPGFQLGEGYLPWASDYSSSCFTRRISLFTQYDCLQTTQQLIAEIPRYHLTDFVYLNLWDKILTLTDAQAIIQAVIAQGASLKNLQLGWNPINELPLNFFADLTQLQNLSLWGDQLSSLTPDLFIGLSQLQNLDLSNNLISNLSLGTFNGLNQLQSLMLSNNPLNKIIPGMFSDLIQLKVLDLYSSSISNLSLNTFTGLNQLQSLTLHGNPLNNLQPNIFADLEQLKNLDLSWTKLNNLPVGTFNGLNQLRSLNLAGNFLTDLPFGLFAGLEQLQSLDLCNNLLNSSVMITILLSLPKTLISLNISNNLIITFPNNILSLWPPGLRVLAIGGNPFVPAMLSPAWMNNFPVQLTDFSLGASYCITNISTGTFSNFRQLQSLNLSYNLLNQWASSTLSGLSRLQNLDLSGNSFTVLLPGVFADLLQLQSLYLSKNPLNNLSTNAFYGLIQLQQLFLSETLLSRLPQQVFMSLTQLQSLSLTNNPWLLQLPSGLFSSLSRLQFLDLSFNNLTSIPFGLFTSLSQLKKLNLSSNQISHSPLGVLAGLNQLQDLDVSFNELNLDLLNNLSVNFPYQINLLSVSVSSRNGIVFDKNVIEWDINLLPCLTQLSEIWISGDIESGIEKWGFSYILSIHDLVFQQLLRNSCEEQLCHANLPPQKLCSAVTTSHLQTVTPATYSDRFLTSGQPRKAKMQKSSLLALPYFDSNADSFFPNTSLIADVSSTIPIIANFLRQDDLSKPVVVGGTVLSVTVLSILLYKNSTWVKAVVDTGCQMIQACWKTTTTTASKYFAKTSWRSTLWGARPYRQQETTSLTASLGK